MITIAWSCAVDAAAAIPRSVPHDSVSDDRALVDAARGGSEAAFRVLVDRYRDRIFGLALRISGSREPAQEIAQDTFVRAWQALPHFRGDSRFSTWIYRIAYRRALDERALLARRREREPALEESDVAAAVASESRSPDWATRLRLERCIRALPEALRACVTLFYAADQSVEEIAGVLGVPAGTVKTHLHRARGELRARMQEARGGPARGGATRGGAASESGRSGIDAA